MEPGWLKKMFKHNATEVAMWPPSMKKLYEDQTGRKLPDDPRISALTAERDQLRAEVERLRGDMAAICRITKGNQADLSKPVDTVATYVTDVRGRINAATARAEAAERERDELQALIDVQHTRVVEANKLWRKAHPGNDLVMPDLGRLVGWLLSRAEAAEAHAADLRGALAEVNEAICNITGIGNIAKQVAGAFTAINAALALTPAQSLAQQSAASLRATAAELDRLRDHIQDYIAPDDARDDIRRICLNRAKDLRSEADRLEKEDANGR